MLKGLEGKIKIIAMVCVITLAGFYPILAANTETTASFTYFSMDTANVTEGEAITFTLTTMGADSVFAVVDEERISAEIKEYEGRATTWELRIIPEESKTVLIYAHATGKVSDSAIISIPVTVPLQPGEIKPEPELPVAEPTPVNLRLTIGNLMYTLNGTAFFMEAAPFIEDGRPMVHLPAIAKALGAYVSWDAAKRTIGMIYDNRHFILIANNVPLPGDIGTAITRDNRTFVPISYIEKHFNVTVIWDEAEQAIYISQSASGDEQTQENYYDHNAIVAAWRNGDRTGVTSGLSPMNREVLVRAAAILQELGIEGMTDTQAKRALYNWFAANVVYDRQFLNNAPGARRNPNSDNPHGALINGVAICYGYAYAYQLFMDMLGIGGVTVHGISPTGSHSWNLVKIDEDWHVVDVPWRLIDVSSQYLWNRGFRWDRDSIPEAR